MNTSSPRIGITLDWEAGSPTGWSKMDHYALRVNYCTAVSRHGAVALPLPHDLAGVDAYLDLIDGLMLTGGAFDIDPSHYGVDQRHDATQPKELRTAFELAMCRGALERKLPVFGICGGEQLLAVALGGRLIQHIPDSIKQALAHEQPNPRNEPGHVVHVRPGTLLHSITGTELIEVNSAHHQAVETAGRGHINAVAEDEVVEGIELSTDEHPFALGVQWHPEYDVSAADEKICAAFVAACRR